MMSKFSNKRFNLYRLIMVALCLCLSFNSVAGALIMVHHDMAPADHAAQQQNVSHIEHHANQHADAHDCCADGQEGCATFSACATHCAASFAQRALNLCPVTALSAYEADTVLTSPLSLSLDGPFKPPR